MALIALFDLTDWLWAGLIERISWDRGSRTCGRSEDECGAGRGEAAPD